MQKLEQNPVIEKNDIIGNNAEKALAALEQREGLVLAKANDFGIGEIQCTEFTHRQEEEVCSFINGKFPDLENLLLPVKK